MCKTGIRRIACDAETLREWVGGMDIYLLDQVLKGRITKDMTLLDAGCDRGRNLVFFMRWGLEVYGLEPKEASIRETRRLASELSPHLPSENFRQERIGSMSFADASFDAVICNAVLHFAEDDQAFQDLVSGLWRVLRPGGLLFCRLASRKGIETAIEPISGRRARLPDGTTRYLVDDELLLRTTEALRAKLVEPIKTVNVQDQRCMATWILRKTDSVLI